MPIDKAQLRSHEEPDKSTISIKFHVTQCMGFLCSLSFSGIVIPIPHYSVPLVLYRLPRPLAGFISELVLKELGITMRSLLDTQARSPCQFNGLIVCYQNEPMHRNPQRNSTS